MKLKKEIIIGFIILISIVVGFVGLSFLKGSYIFSNDKIYYTKFEDLNNVATATPIKISGYKVGNVKKVLFDYNRGKGAVLELSIDPEVVIYKGSKIKMVVNPLSGSELFILPPSDNESYILLSSKDTIPSIEGSGDLMGKITNEIIPSVTTILPIMHSTMERINSVVQDKSIDNTIKSLEITSKNIEILSNRLSQSISAIDNILSNVSKTSENMLDFTNDIKRVEMDSISAGLKDASVVLSHISKQLKSKDNNIGLLLNDDRIYKRLDSLINKTDSLVSDMKANPRKYINLKIF